MLSLVDQVRIACLGQTPALISLIKMSKKNIQFISQDEPSFIKNFKAKVGYKEPTGISAKVSCEWSF